jgi:type II secretory pathway component GspD/PulD (secretin)
VSALTFTGLGGEGAGSTAILNALRSTGNSVVHKPLQLLTMNGRLKVQNSTDTQGYVESTTPGLASASGSAGAPGLNAKSLTTGDIFAVLPIVQPDNSVLLKYSFRMSNFLGFRNIVSGLGNAQQSVEAPHTSDVGDGTDVRLMPGESMMITGLSRTSTSSNGNRVAEGAPIGLGGSTSNSVRREHFIVVLRANAL